MHGNLSKAQKAYSSLSLLLVYSPLMYIIIILSLYFIFNPMISFTMRITFGIIYYTITGYVIILHLLCIMISPGIVPNKYQLSELQMKHSAGLYCNKCANYRPPRASHCFQCNSCVLKMDHHCIWIINCVGCKNQKYFFIFLSYLMIALCMSMIQIVILIVMYRDTLISRRSSNEKIKTVIEYFLQFKGQYLLLIAFILIIFFMISVGVIYWKQVKGLLKNSTMIEEDIYGEITNPYSHRKIIKNVKIVLGENIWEWFIPLNRIKEDGLNYIEYKDNSSGDKDKINDDADDIKKKEKEIVKDKENAINNNNKNYSNRSDNSAKEIKKENKVGYYKIKGEIDSTSIRKFDSSQVSSNYDFFQINHIKNIKK